MVRGSDAADDAGCRLDVWLWATRFFKTRSLAKDAIVGGKIAVNDQTAKPSRQVHVGDRLVVIRSGERFEITVVTLAHQRGSAAIATACFTEDPASAATRLALREQKRFEALGMQPPDGKPDKRARRLLIALGDFDAG